MLKVPNVIMYNLNTFKVSNIFIYNLKTFKVPNIFIYNLKTFEVTFQAIIFSHSWVKYPSLLSLVTRVSQVVQVLSKHAGLWVTKGKEIMYSQVKVLLPGRKLSSYIQS